MLATALAVPLSALTTSSGSPVALSPAPDPTSVAAAGDALTQMPPMCYQDAPVAARPAIPIAGSQPFTGVPSHPDERYEAKGALQWLPQVKWAVGDAVRAGLLREDERQLWENVLLGMVGLESTGKLFHVPNPTSPWYSQGLTQLTYASTYREENPFDALTNLRGGLRACIRYYRKWGNRWDRAVAQHLTGAEDEHEQRYRRDWNGTSGEDYPKRIANIVWWASQLQASGDLYPARSNNYQADCTGGWFDRAPSWSIWDSPNLPYNWLPPTNNTAYGYVQAGADGNKSLPVARNTWAAFPEWLYATSPAPGIAAITPRQPADDEARAYPAGRTDNVPWGETYPRRTWSLGNP